MVSLVYRELHAALKTAMDRLKARPDGAGEWANSWHSIYPCMAIVENRQTKLHNDSNGAPRAAEFLTTLGDFSGGELHLPGLKLKLDWTPNTACMFDGRSFSHEVLAFQGPRRLCLIGYLWKSSMERLEVQLPQAVPTLEDLRAQAKHARGTEVSHGSAIVNANAVLGMRQEMAERSRKISEYGRRDITSVN